MLQVVLFFSLCYLFIVYKYGCIRKRKVKTERDVYWRRILVESLSYLLILNLITVLLIQHLLGNIRIWGASAEYLGEFITLVELFVLIAYFSVRPIRKITETIYLHKDIEDIRYFILYLRPFETEKNKEDKKICKAFSKLWETVAVGNPNEFMPGINATRFFLPDDKWQNGVQELIQKSKAILMRVGNTKGAIWEMDKILNDGLLNKTIFIIHTKEEYDVLKGKLTSLHIYNLPDADFNIKGCKCLILEDAECLEWGIYDILTYTEAKQLADKYISMHENLRPDLKYKITGVKKGFVSHFLGTSKLPYYRWRVWIYFIVAYAAAYLLGIYAHKIEYSNMYSYHENRYGYLSIEKSENVIYDYDLLFEEKLKFMDISHDYKKMAIAVTSNDSTFIIVIDLTSDKFEYSHDALNYGYYPNLESMSFHNGSSRILHLNDGKNNNVSVYSLSLNDVFYNLDYSKVAEEIGYSINDTYLIDKYFIMSSSNGISIFDRKTYTLLYQEHKNGYTDHLSCVIDSSSTRMFISGEEKIVYCLELDHIEKIHEYKTLTKSPKHIIIHPQNEKIAVVGNLVYGRDSGRPFTISLFDINTEELLVNMIGHRWSVDYITFNRDGSKLLSISEDETIRIWDTNTGKELYKIVWQAYDGKKYSGFKQAAFISNDTQILAYINDELRVYTLPIE